jgi:Xaa-Pro dipeptidase
MAVVGLAGLAEQRLARLREEMQAHGTEAILTADPINIVYATGVRNMTVFSMMGAARFALVIADGPVVLWEFPGSEHLATDVVTFDEVRTAPGLTAHAGPGHVEAIGAFAEEVADVCRTHLGNVVDLAIERFDHPVSDALRRVGFALRSATETFVASRMIKLPDEVTVIREAVVRVEAAVAAMRAAVLPGATEVEVWSYFHQALIAGGGEYVSTRLAQSGGRTFPYFQEAGDRRLERGDLFAIDTDAIAIGGYGVDLSRTFLCGDGAPTARQLDLHRLAREQLSHNADLLSPGLPFSEFTERSWRVPDHLAPYGYYCLAHGLGMSGEHPYLPARSAGSVLPGHFEPGMVICVESYVGDPATRQGVKLEDQFLITGDGAERLTNTPFDERLDSSH